MLSTHQTVTPIQEVRRRQEELAAAETARKREREAKRQAKDEAIAKRRAVDIRITTPDNDPVAKALREKIRKEKASVTAELAAAERACEEARLVFEAADRVAIEAEVASDVGESVDTAKARLSLQTAEEKLKDTQERLRAARRDAERQEQRTELMSTKLAEAVSRAEKQMQAEGMRLLRDELDRARTAIASAVEANERLFCLSRALQSRGVNFFDPHYEGLLTVETWGKPTGFGNWLDRLEKTGFGRSQDISVP